jgi:hypothetical protein
MVGSLLRKHISTWLAIACARARPSSSRRLSTAPPAKLSSSRPSQKELVRCRLQVSCPLPDRAEAKGCQSSVCLVQEAPDTLSITSPGGLEVLQSLLGNDQLLHLSLRQLLLSGRQSCLLVP